MLFRFPSSRDPSLIYNTTISDDDGTPDCECTGFINHRHCWHIKEAAASLHRERTACPDCGGALFTDTQAVKGIPGAMVGGKAWVRTVTVRACSTCEWIKEV